MAVAAGLVCLMGVLGLAACSGSDEPDESPPAGQGGGGEGGQGGVTWVSGANGNYPDHIAPWAEWTGRPVGLAMVFTNRDSWESIVSPDWPLSAFTRDKFPGELSIAQPLWPIGRAQPGACSADQGCMSVEEQAAREQACASGEYDQHWQEFGRNLVRYGRGDAYVRLAWEFNGPWFDFDPVNIDTWKACYRRAVTALRSTAPDVRIEWTMTMHRDKLPNGRNVWDAYPGDEYVDVIGIDYYDMYPPAPTQKIWDRLCKAPSGLCTVVDEARKRGKQFSVPEWGVVSGDGGGGDNPFFIQKMYEVFRANADILAYEAYYNNAEPNNVQSSLVNPVINPKSAERYLELFGAG
ncbi:MAG: glycosidase [Frankia sp.]|nr:glycosidase [Frankia sp.]